MSYASDVETIQHAKKYHYCDWCNQSINIGEPYKRWRWFESRNVITVRSHFEYHEAQQNSEYADEEVYDRANQRGCTCRGERDCERCAEVAAGLLKLTKENEG